MVKFITQPLQHSQKNISSQWELYFRISLMSPLCPYMVLGIHAQIHKSNLLFILWLWSRSWLIKPFHKMNQGRTNTKKNLSFKNSDSEVDFQGITLLSYTMNGEIIWNRYNSALTNLDFFLHQNTEIQVSYMKLCFFSVTKVFVSKV